MSSRRNKRTYSQDDEVGMPKKGGPLKVPQYRSVSPESHRELSSQPKFPKLPSILKYKKVISLKRSDNQPIFENADKELGHKISMDLSSLYHYIEKSNQTNFKPIKKESVRDSKTLIRSKSIKAILDKDKPQIETRRRRSSVKRKLLKRRSCFNVVYKLDNEFKQNIEKIKKEKIKSNSLQEYQNQLVSEYLLC